VIERFRGRSLTSRELAKQTLEEVTVLVLTSFPQAILPNKLVKELGALATTAELKLPLVEEVAADIFMGTFSGKFLESAKVAAELLEGSLYDIYFGIGFGAIRRLRARTPKIRRYWPWSKSTTRKPEIDEFAQLCALRADVSLGTWDPAVNGMILEQQQILTTQNLAAMFVGLGLTDVLRDRLEYMSRQSFVWICQRQQMKIDQWHAQLIMIKQTAYAWRQMIFFLSLLSDRSVADFLRWADEHLTAQSPAFRNRFRPALTGLALAAAGVSVESEEARKAGAKPFLGWSKAKHWLLTDIIGPID
jgi:hypothetical protein